MNVVSKNLRIEGNVLSYDHGTGLYRILWNRGSFYWKTWSMKNEFSFIVKAPTRRIENA